MWIERPGKIFFTAVEGDHVHLGLPVDFPFDNEIQFDILFDVIQWYIFLKKSLTAQNILSMPRSIRLLLKTRNVDRRFKFEKVLD